MSVCGVPFTGVPQRGVARSTARILHTQKYLLSLKALDSRGDLQRSKPSRS